MFPSESKARKSKHQKLNLNKLHDNNSHTRRNFGAAHFSSYGSERRGIFDQPLVANVRRAADDSGPGYPLCLECICHAAGKELGWRRAQTSSVFTLAVVTFAASLLLAGKLQDRFGPFWISVTGSILVSLSFLLFAHTSSLFLPLSTFSAGVLGGIGLGFGFGTVVPVMAKWFPDRTGLAIGLALAGLGGGSAVFGSFANLMLFPRFGWRASCMILGGIFLVMTLTGAFLLKNPEASRQTTEPISVNRMITARHQFTPGEVLRTPAFYLLWLGFGLGSTAGLMVISQLIPFANSQGVASATLATLGLTVGAAGNVSGRVLSGWLSDIMGRLNTLRVVLAMSSVAMPLLYWVGAHLAALYVLIFVVYFCYGAQASVIPFDGI